MMSRFGQCVVCVALAGMLFAPAARAQYTADFQTNIISGITSNWFGTYVVGSNTFADALVLQSTGVLNNASGYIGYESNSSNNSVWVSDAGTAWNNRFALFVGYSGGGNG